ncbi:MAG: response regulator [Gemmatimonadaceae bacterium]|nr:response regulator [Gemmatimonadaceae bacterium]
MLDCNAIVAGVKPMLSRLIREDVTVEIRLAEHLGWILADSSQLEQVVLNLAVNARDAMPRGGHLLIETGETTLTADAVMEDRSIVMPGRYVSIGVSDTGTGIAPEVRSHIFEPFFTTKPVGSGTGLGLATVYGIVKHFGGYLQVDSVVGRGTTICVMLPVATSALSIAEPARPARNTAGTETVLLVEDMDALREIARRVLGRSGYTVLEARNGRDALDVARAHGAPIHLLLTDVVMPEMNGLRLAEQLQRARPDVAVLFMSGYAEDDDARRGVEEARAGFIHKPFSPAQLLLAVREALEA